MKVRWLLPWVLAVVHASAQETAVISLADADSFSEAENTTGNTNTTTEPDVTVKDSGILKPAEDESGALKGLYKMSRGFVHAVAPDELLLDQVIEFLNDSKKFEIPGDGLKLIKAEAGFMTCLVLGLLLFFGLGIVGTCFCSCRCCCGNCGGKKIQDQKDNSSARRKTYFFLLFVVLFLMIVAIALGYTVSKALSTSIVQSEGKVIAILDEADIFFNTTTTQLTELASDGLENTTDQVRAQLNGINETIGYPLRDECLTAIKNVEKLSEGINKAVQTVKDAQVALKTLSGDPIKKIKDVQVELQRIKKACTETPCTTMDTGDEVTPEQEIPPGDLDSVPNVKLEEEMKKAKDEINKIPDKLKDKTETKVNELDQKLNGFVNDFQAGSFQKAINESSEVTKFVPDTKVKVHDAYEHVRKYEPNINYTLSAIFALVAIPTFLMFLGMICGCAGQRDSRSPRDRGGLSNCGGCSIITAVYLFFFITGIPILATIFLFQLGGNLEAHICKVVYQEDLKPIDNLFDYMKGQIKLDGDLFKELQPSTAFKECKNGSTIYKALKLESVFNIDEQLDIDKQLDLKDKLGDLDIKVDGDIFNNSVKDEIQKLVDFDSKNMDEVAKRLKNPLVTDNTKFDEWIQNLEQLKDAVTTQGTKDRLQAQIGILRTVNLDTIAKQRATLSNELSEVKFKERGIKLKEEIKKTEEEIQNIANQKKDEFVTHLVDMAEGFVLTVKFKVQNEIGQCKPIWVIFDNSRNLLCRDLLNPINGYWFSLGWAIVFSIFAIIFGTKLARFYQRMSDEPKQSRDDRLMEARDFTRSEGQPCIPLKDSHEYYSNQGYQSPPRSPPAYASPQNYSYGPNVNYSYGPNVNYPPPPPQHRQMSYQNEIQGWHQY